MQRLPAILMLAIIVLSGCACRSKGARPSDPTNLWNRNEVVAVPTFAGNLMGTALSIPFLYLAYGLLSPLRLESRKTYSEACGRATALIPLSFAYGGGAFLGTPFILPSLFFADDPDYCWAD